MIDSLASGIGQFLNQYSMPIAMGAQAASVIARHQANKRIAEEQGRRAHEERRRQAEIADESRARFRETLPKFSAGATEGRRAEKQASIERMIAPSAAASPVIQNYHQAVSAGRPAVVGEGIAAKVNEALSAGQDHARRAALATSFGSSRAGDNRMLNRAGADVSRLGRDSSRSARILDLEMAEALNKGRGPATASSILGGLGHLSAAYGLSRRK